MKNRIAIPHNAALTDNLRPLADALTDAYVATDDARLEVARLASTDRDTEARKADDTAVRDALAAGKQPPASVTTKAADKLAADRRIAAAALDLAEQHEAEKAHQFHTALRDASSEVIDHNQARAEAAAKTYRKATAAFLEARNAYLGTVTDLATSVSRHLDREHWEQHPTRRRQISAYDPGPRTNYDTLNHPRLPYDIRPTYMKEILEHDATRHEYPDPRKVEVSA